jgi:hypothetical protein
MEDHPLKRFRALRGWGRKDLALAAMVSVPEVCLVENGQIGIPKKLMVLLDDLLDSNEYELLLSEHDDHRAACRDAALARLMGGG